MPEFYMIIARKMPEFYIIIARKIFFPNLFFFGGGGRAPLCTPSPTPVAKFGENIYDRAILTL